MSKSFDSGVASYIHGVATIHVYFPVDSKGNADISCSQCEYFREASKRCGITGSVTAYPNKYVGAGCPFEEVKEEEKQ